MKALRVMVMTGVVFVFLQLNAGYTQTVVVPPPAEMKTIDVNKDGTPDVTYYREGEYVSKIEADTNYDGKPDVIVHVKDGKFQSAEADTDYNGSMETKFTDEKAFKKWINDTHPQFAGPCDRRDWQLKLITF